MGRASRRNRFLKILEEARQKYRFVVVGYVVMPEHFHMLISEPEQGTPSTVTQVVKQRFAHQVLKLLRKKGPASQPRLWEEPDHVWQRRFYDFNVWTEKKRAEKLRYMHRNPVKRGLVLSPEQWLWSSFRWYAMREPGLVKVNDWDVHVLKICKAA
jgi:putative transposase